MIQADNRYSAVLVDDSRDIRALIRARLETTGRFRVVDEAGDGRMAIDMARKYRPDVMTLDLSMPIMDGLEALPQVLNASPNTAVLIFTGFETPELREQALRLGAADVLQKGASIRTLPNHLLEMLDDEKPPVQPLPIAEAEQMQLADHLERFKEIFDEAAIGMATLTLPGRIARANRAATALLADVGGPPLVGHHYVDFVDESARERVSDALQEVASGAPARQVEHMFRRSHRAGLSSINSIRDVNGSPLYLFVQTQDVSDLRETRGALHDAENRFDILVDSVTDYAIFMLDTGGHVTSWNRGAERIKGYAQNEVHGRHFRMFYPPDAQAKRYPENALKAAVRDGRYESTAWRVRKDGSLFWASVVITPMHGPDGVLIGFAKVTRDISDRLP